MSDLKIDRVLEAHDKRIRKEAWAGIVIHHTGIGDRVPKDASLWKKLHENIANYLARKDDKYVSAHFQVGRQGEITLLVDPEKYVAFHAGESSFWNAQKRKWQIGCNDFMIGIEIVGDGNLTSYSEEQYHSVARICRYLMDRYPSIAPHGITGHEVVSPLRKVDPGIHFDWRKLFALIFEPKIEFVTGATT